jgi:hypothetical protein
MITEAEVEQAWLWFAQGDLAASTLPSARDVASSLVTAL